MMHEILQTNIYEIHEDALMGVGQIHNYQSNVTMNLITGTDWEMTKAALLDIDRIDREVARDDIGERYQMINAIIRDQFWSV